MEDLLPRDRLADHQHLEELMLRRYIPRFCILSLLVLAQGCGNDAGFSGETAAKGNEDLDANPVDGPIVGNDDDGAPYSELTWFWQCETNPVATPPVIEDGFVVQGTGPHK